MLHCTRQRRCMRLRWWSREICCTSHGTEAHGTEEHVTYHKSHVTYTPHVTRHTLHAKRHTSYVTRHTSHVTRHTSHVTRHTSHLKVPQQACTSRRETSPATTIGRGSHTAKSATHRSRGNDAGGSNTNSTRQRQVARQPRTVTRHTSHVTRHTSHVTHHTSHVTRHTSHVTRHTSHVTRHTHSLSNTRVRHMCDGVNKLIDDGPTQRTHDVAPEGVSKRTHKNARAR
jgi:hypothetical protein